MERLKGHMKFFLLATVMASISFGAIAQDYPSKPIKLIVGFAPGGGSDIVARLLADPLGKKLGKPVIVENKPGGGSTIAADFVAKAPADGYTLLLTPPGPQMTNPFLMPKLPYDPATDLIPVTQLAVVPSVLVVRKDMPVNSIQELFEYAKNNPGKINFSSSGLGSTSHLSGELLKQKGGLDIVHVPYRGSGAAVADLLAGQVQMSIDSLAVYKAYIDAGTLRALAVSTLKESPLIPKVPPVSAVIPGFEGSPILYISVRAGVSDAIVAKLNKEINEILSRPDIKEQFAKKGLTAQGSTPAQMQALIQSEAEKWKEVIKVSGARIE